MIPSLRELFSEYGNILDIVAKTNLKAKGQAFIVFDNVESAKKAIEEVQGFELFGKEIRLQFARERSDASVLKEEGEEGLEVWKRRRRAEMGKLRVPASIQASSCHMRISNSLLKHCGVFFLRQLTFATDKKKAASSANDLKRLKHSGPVPAMAADAAARPLKSARGAGLRSTNPGAGAIVPDEYLPPNKILFVQNVPEEYDIEALTVVFSRFEGFREVRMVPGRKGIAFVEYESETGAIGAKEATGGMMLGQRPIKVTYQRQ